MKVPLHEKSSWVKSAIYFLVHWTICDLLCHVLLSVSFFFPFFFYLHLHFAIYPHYMFPPHCRPFLFAQSKRLCRQALPVPSSHRCQCYLTAVSEMEANGNGTANVAIIHRYKWIAFAFSRFVLIWYFSMKNAAERRENRLHSFRIQANVEPNGILHFQAGAKSMALFIAASANHGYIPQSMRACWLFSGDGKLWPIFLYKMLLKMP